MFCFCFRPAKNMRSLLFCCSFFYYKTSSLSLLDALKPSMGISTARGLNDLSQLSSSALPLPRELYLTAHFRCSADRWLALLFCRCSVTYNRTPTPQNCPHFPLAEIFTTTTYYLFWNTNPLEPISPMPALLIHVKSIGRESRSLLLFVSIKSSLSR